MRGWFQDNLFRSVVRNAGYLGSGKLAGALLGLVSLACAGRGLTPALFGVLMIVHTYALSAAAIIKFQTWQFVVRYGAPALKRGDTATARDAIRFSTGLDLASGVIGMAAAMAALPLLGPRFGLTGNLFWLALGYCTLVPTMTAATPLGVLRLFDRFELAGGQQIVNPLIRSAGAAITYFGDFGLIGFLLAWYVGDMAGDLALWGLAARELKRRDMLDAFRPGLFGVAHGLPRCWHFVWNSNLAFSLSAAWGPLSNLMVATVLGPVSAGLYKIAATLIDSTAKPADLLRRGFYPEIMRLDPASKRPWRLGLRVAALSACIGIVLVLVITLGGEPVIAFVFGRKYLPASELLQIMAWALVVSTAVFPLESLLYMVDRQQAALAAQIAASAAYMGLLYGLALRFGLVGAGYAFLIGTILNGLFLLIPTVQSYRARHLSARPELRGTAGAQANGVETV